MKNEALKEIEKTAPEMLKLFAKALERGARIEAIKLRIRVPQFDGKELEAIIDLDGDVTWNI